MSQNRAEMRSINSGFAAMALPRCSESRDLAEFAPHMLLLVGSQASRSDGSLLAPSQPVQDGSVQTELHPEAARRDPLYVWNEWELRRRAIQLTNLRQKVTTSSQTASSCLRRESQTQVYLPRESGTNTGVSTGTAPPRSVNYVAGLRGAPGSKMQVVNLVYDPEITIGRGR